VTSVLRQFCKHGCHLSLTSICY